jgi:hypothetical protein
MSYCCAREQPLRRAVHVLIKGSGEAGRLLDVAAAMAGIVAGRASHRLGYLKAPLTRDLKSEVARPLLTVRETCAFAEHIIDCLLPGERVPH